MYRCSDRDFHVIDALVNRKDVEKLEQIEKLLLKNASPSDLVTFVGRVDKLGFVNKDRIVDKLIEKNAYSDLLHFARRNKDIDIKKVEDAIANGDDMLALCHFAAEIKGADIGKLQQAVAKSNNSEAIYLFAYNVKKSDKKILSKAIASCTNICNLSYSLDFAKNIPDADIEAIEDAIIKTDVAKAIYEFARDVKGANIQKLQEAIICTRYAPYIRMFAGRIKGADKARLTRIADKIEQRRENPKMKMQLVDFDKFDLNERTEEMLEDMNNFEK